MTYAENISDLIGHTPLIKLQALSKDAGATILGKLESFNPGGSVKDRIGLSMILAAERPVRSPPARRPWSSRPAATPASRSPWWPRQGLPPDLDHARHDDPRAPRTAQGLRRRARAHTGRQGHAGAVAAAGELLAEHPGAFVPQQFENPANPEIHRETTAEEVWNDTDGKIDIFLAAVGTGGTVTGVGEVLKARKPAVQVYAAEPAASPVLSGGQPGPHKIQGTGAGFVPKVLNTSVYDGIIQVGNDEAIETARNLARDEGILVGISAGANAWAAWDVGRRPENQGKLIVTVMCDTGERYLSSVLFAEPEVQTADASKI